MKCSVCGAEWNIGSDETLIKKCPICDMNYMTQPENRTFSDIPELLFSVRAEKGIDYFADSKKVLALLNDYFPSNKEERNTYAVLFDNGIGDSMIALSAGETSDDAIRRTVELIDDKREKYVEDILYIIGRITRPCSDIHSAEFYLTQQNNLTKDEYVKIALAKADNSNKDNSSIRAIIDIKLKSGDINGAIDDLNSLVASDDNQAAYKLGMMYLNGKYISEDIEKAYELLNISLRNNNAEAAYELGKIQATNSKYYDYDLAITNFKIAAEHDNSNAMCWLYHLLYKKDETKSDAMIYLFNASKLGNISGMYEYAVHLLYGDDVKQEITVAVAMLNKCASLNDVDAINKLIYLYSSGSFVKKDVSKAKYYKDKLKEIC